MNSTLKGIIIFASGAAVGATSMYFALKKYFELKADLEIEEVRKVYDDKVNEIEGVKDSISGDIEGEKEIDGEKLSHKEIINRLNNKPDLTDYTKYFKEKGTVLPGVNETLRDAKEAADSEGLSEEELAERELAEGIDPSEMEHPQDDEEEQSLDEIDRELNGASREAIALDKPPYEIEPSDWELTCGNYEKISLTYYQFDQIVANEEEEVIDEALLIGDVIERSGFDQNSEDVLYVRNDKIMADFEITKVYEAYGKNKD